MDKFFSIFIHLVIMVSYFSFPFISKRDVVFGIKIPENANKDQDVIKIKKQFLSLVALVGVTLIIIQLLNNTDKVLMITILGGLIPYYLVYLLSYKAMKKLKKEKQWQVGSSKTVVDTQFRTRRISIPNSWYLLYLVIILIGVVATIMTYDSLPDMLNVQFNTAGEVTNTMEKDKALIMMFTTQIAVMLLLIFIQYIIRKAKQQLSSHDVEKSIKENTKFRYIFSVLVYLLGLTVGIVFLMTLFFSLNILTDLTLITVLTLTLTFIPLGALILYSIKYGQDGSRLGKAKDSDVIEKEDDSYWKLGLFYYNPNDPSVFISKRVGVGWSVNHARWQAWAFYVGIVAVVIYSVIIGR